jgi:hypothetical protein
VAARPEAVFSPQARTKLGRSAVNALTAQTCCAPVGLLRTPGSSRHGRARRPRPALGSLSEPSLVPIVEVDPPAAGESLVCRAKIPPIRTRARSRVHQCLLGSMQRFGRRIHVFGEVDPEPECVHGRDVWRLNRVHYAARVSTKRLPVRVNGFVCEERADCHADACLADLQLADFRSVTLWKHPHVGKRSVRPPVSSGRRRT